MYVSIGLRMKIEVEALNMVEPLGAYIRHRTVPLIRKIPLEQGKIRYRVVMAPAISGQSINNGYSRVLVELAQIYKLPLCEECSKYRTRGGFTKRTTVKDLKFDDRIMTCVIDDITGFMAPEAGVRKTSPVMFSNMIPDIEHSKAIIDSQFHVRYNFETNEHAPFNIEIGSAIYMLSIFINVDEIGKLTDQRYVNDRTRRVELAFKGLEALIEGFNFGGHKARYLPIHEVLGGVAAISEPLPFMVSKPKMYYGDKSYIEETVERANRYVNALKDFNEKIKIVYFDKEGLVKNNIVSSDLIKTNTYIEFIEKILEALGIKNNEEVNKSVKF